MLNQAMETRRDKVAGVVTAILAKHAVPAPVPAAADLAKLGMTSIDMVELMLAVEAEFDMMIPPTEITAENFRSISTIDALIGRLNAQTF